MDVIVNKLYELADEKFRLFTSKSVPNISMDNIIGVRIPDIRKLAKEIKNDSNIEEFLNDLPHKYLEENILHGIILSTKYKDINIVLDRLDNFLVYVDNWIVTDIISPIIFKKYPDIVYNRIKVWISSNNEYMIRFGIVSLLKFYLNKDYIREELKIVMNVKYDSYYVNMAKAWFYSFALIKQWDNTIKYFQGKKLDKWVHNKSIQKAIESYRVSDMQKEYLRKLKIK